MTEESKTCFKCGATKPIGRFYRHPQMGDGRLNKCKECTKRDVSSNYRKNLDHYKEYERSRANLPHRVRRRREYAALYASKFPERCKAHNAVSNAVRDGRLEKPSVCEKCGDGGVIHGHHHDYTKPLEVDWLCVTCHFAVHRQICS